jgi:carbon storage regulator
MLILTRRIGESLAVIEGKDIFIRVSVLGVKGNQVRIGIAAPKKWTIMREELLKKPDFQMQGLIDKTTDGVEDK